MVASADNSFTLYLNSQQVLAGGVVRERYDALLARVPEAIIATGVAS